ncbi:MAG: L,D-transpeptidase family protein [Nitrosomonas sp.]|nr:L,D-transpeptidase family protein [Nitrosomonas sp.]
MKPATLFLQLLQLILMLAPLYAQAKSWILPPSDVDIFGEILVTPANREETLLDIARRHEIGQDEILLANPNVNRWLPEQGAEVVLPSRYILPQAKRTGLVINLPEMRLYYFPKSVKGEKPNVITYPVSIGRMDWKTPLGKTTITRKQKDPTWTPPQSLKDEAMAATGEHLPNIVPAGPDNPLGRYALYLGLPGYLIHSTNKPFGVGMRVTHGCIRMYPENIEALFSIIPAGTPVQIVNQPIKLGWLGKNLYIELHPLLEEELTDTDLIPYPQEVHAAIQSFLQKTGISPDDMSTSSIRIDEAALDDAIKRASGIPTLISAE